MKKARIICAEQETESESDVRQKKNIEKEKEGDSNNRHIGIRVPTDNNPL